MASSSTNIFDPKITTNADSQDKADQHNTSQLSEIGVKEAIASAITLIVGAQITNPILLTTDGLEFRRVDEYALHHLISAFMGGAEQPSAPVIRQMMVDMMATTFDWGKSATTNLEKLSTAIIGHHLRRSIPQRYEGACDHRQCRLRRTTEMGLRSGGGMMQNQGQVLIQQVTRCRLHRRHDEVSGRRGQATKSSGGNGARVQQNFKHGKPGHQAVAPAGATITILLCIH